MTLTAATVDAIRERILNRTYAEGEQLRQDELATTLGISRGAVKSHASRAAAALRTHLSLEEDS